MQLHNTTGTVHTFLWHKCVVLCEAFSQFVVKAAAETPKYSHNSRQIPRTEKDGWQSNGQGVSYSS